MDAKEAIKKLNELAEESDKLKIELDNLNRTEEDILTLLKISSVFDESLVEIVANLLTTMEKDDYVPFIYEKYSELFTNPEILVASKCIGITKYKNIPLFSESENLDELLKKQCGYDICVLHQQSINEKDERKKPYIGLYSKTKDYNKTVFTFNFLLKSFGNVDPYYPVRISYTDFNEFNYVQNYIRYIFDLQVERNGKRLNYEELKEALDEFLKLDKAKVKSKSLY